MKNSKKKRKVVKTKSITLTYNVFNDGTIEISSEYNGNFDTMEIVGIYQSEIIDTLKRSADDARG